MTGAEELARQLQAALERLHQELETIPNDRWENAVTGPEGWNVGYAAHPIGEGYLQSLEWIETATRTGQPVELDPVVAIPAVNAANARCLIEHGTPSRADTMAFLKANADRLIGRVRTLSDT